eukprot:44582-Hanusia_phi.AAC.1
MDPHPPSELTHLPHTHAHHPTEPGDGTGKYLKSAKFNGATLPVGHLSHQESSPCIRSTYTLEAFLPVIVTTDRFESQSGSAGPCGAARQVTASLSPRVASYLAPGGAARRWRRADAVCENLRQPSLSNPN